MTQEMFAIEGIQGIKRKGDGRGAVVLLHGYGAGADDLAPLASLLPDECDYYFPEGPLSIPIAPGYFGRAWFPIDVLKLQEALATGRRDDLESNQPEGLILVGQQLLPFLRHLAGRYTDGIMIGGFSQGGMVALQSVLEGDLLPKGLLLLSTNPINFAVWQKLLPRLAGTPFFLSHGMQDPVLPFEGALRLATVMQKAGLVPEVAQFAGGHEIPMPVILGLQKFIQTYLSSTT